MSLRKLNAALVILNVITLAVVVRQAKLLHGQRESLTSSGSSNSSAINYDAPAPSSARGMPHKVRFGGTQEVEQTRPPEVKLFPARPESEDAAKRPIFDWRQVESTNYGTYIGNLRAIGVPEQTVRDIVLADVTQTYAAKREEIMAERFRDFQYWKADSDEAAARAKLEKQQRETDTSMRSVLQQLLGSDTLAPSTAAAWKQAALEQQLAFLPSDTREPITKLLLQYAGVDAKFKELADFHTTIESPDERLQVIEANNQKLDSLQSLLTPEQFEQLDMTVSWTADNLRRAMTKFEPTEEEFRMIFREWRAHDERLAILFARGEPDPGNAQVFSNIANFLTPERFAQYRETWWK